MVWVAVMKLQPGLGAFYVPSGNEMDWTYFTARGMSTVGYCVCFY